MVGLAISPVLAGDSGTMIQCRVERQGEILSHNSTVLVGGEEIVSLCMYVMRGV